MGNSVQVKKKKLKLLNSGKDGSVTLYQSPDIKFPLKISERMVNRNRNEGLLSNATNELYILSQSCC